MAKTVTDMVEGKALFNSDGEPDREAILAYINRGLVKNGEEPMTMEEYLAALEDDDEDEEE